MRHQQSFFTMALVIAAITALTIWATSCKKDDNPQGPGGGGTATVAGIVKDAGANGNPAIANATVSTSATNSTTTGANGQFSLSVAAGTNVTVSITKNGYSLNQVVANVASGATKQVTVNLLTVGATQNMSVSAGGSVTDPNSNAKIQLPANFVNASGNVSVSITGLDPTTGEIRALPGGLDAVDANGNAVYLQPVSFAEYTVKDANGIVLQFNSSAGSGANIELPIPASLRGKAGYRNGDPIECYLYDPADGKWKTPVPGVVGPSSVDGNPAIKATIFHLSWYGGAPATNARACIQGFVKNADGSPAVGVSVEGFAGGQATTDAQGAYRIDAAPNSSVRVVATQVQGTTIRSGEVVIYTGSASDTCTIAPDITLGAAQQGSFEVFAYLAKGLAQGSSSSIGIASINLVLGTGARSGWDSATVALSAGSETWPMTPSGSGSYYVFGGLQGSTFHLDGGVDYHITIDFDRNGTTDANGQVKMTGGIRVISPAESSTVGKMFTSSWQDSATGTPGYGPFYYVSLGGDSGSRFYLTSSTSKVIGDGTIDSSIYGYPQPNDPLRAGSYSFTIWALNGPAGFLQIGGNPSPNINGQGVEGYFYGFTLAMPTYFTSTGVTASGKMSARKQSPPLFLRRMAQHLPPEVRAQLGLKLE